MRKRTTTTTAKMKTAAKTTTTTMMTTTKRRMKMTTTRCRSYPPPVDRRRRLMRTKKTRREKKTMTVRETAMMTMTMTMKRMTKMKKSPRKRIWVRTTSSGRWPSQRTRRTPATSSRRRTVRTRTSTKTTRAPVARSRPLRRGRGQVKMTQTMMTVGRTTPTTGGHPSVDQLTWQSMCRKADWLSDFRSCIIGMIIIVFAFWVINRRSIKVSRLFYAFLLC